MNKPWTHDDVLERLRGEEFFAQWLAAQGVDADEEASEKDRTEAKGADTPHRLWGFDQPGVGEREGHGLRERLERRLTCSAALGHEAGRCAMLDAAARHLDVLAALRRCASDLHRSVWLYIHHRPIFEHAWMLDLMQAQDYAAMQYRVGRGTPRVDEAALAELAAHARSQYQALYGRGERWTIDAAECAAGVVSLCLRSDDGACATPSAPAPLTQAGGAVLRYGHARLYIRLEYSPNTGILRVLAPGKRRCHHALMRAFSRCMLQRELLEHESDPTMLDLAALAGPLEPPDALRDGFVSARLLKLRLRRGVDPATIVYEPAHWRSTNLTVRDRMADELGFDPLGAYWRVLDATLMLGLPGGQAEIEVQLSCNGSSNLYRFEPEVQARIEGFLINAGVMRPDQALYRRLADAQGAWESESMEVS